MATSVEIAELIRRALESRIADVYTSMPGEVVSYDAATKTADIRPLVRKRMPDEDDGSVFEDLPILPSVKVVFPSGGGAKIRWPLGLGDAGVILCSHSDVGTWQAGDGAAVDPVDLRTHNLGAAFFLPGMAPDSEVDLAAEQDALVIEHTEVRLGTHDAAHAAVCEPPTTNHLQSIKAWLDAHTHQVTAIGSPTNTPTPLSPDVPNIGSSRVRIAPP